MEKHPLQVLVAVLMAFPLPAIAHHQQVRDTCNAYRHTETYRPGRYDHNGRWIGGRVVEGQVEIPCSSYGGEVAHAVHHHSHAPHAYPAAVHYPQQQQPQQANPVLINNQAGGAVQQRCSGKLARMGLGGILGGVVGRYAVGGRKSNKTVLGTTIGAVAGSLVGSATC